MSFNARPLRPVGEEDSAAYARDGVVCLRNVFDPEWLQSMERPARRLLIGKEDFGLLPNNPGRYMARTIPEFRRFVFGSPLGEAAAKAIGSSTARFFFDEIFAKKPQSTDKTIWHNDRMGWPVTSESTMVPSLWVPLTPITKANCLEVIAGTQVNDARYWLFSPNALKMIRPEARLPHPDGESMRTDPSYAGQIVTFTFPHIGNVGTNDDDIETTNLAATSTVSGSAGGPGPARSSSA